MNVDWGNRNGNEKVRDIRDWLQRYSTVAQESQYLIPRNLKEDVETQAEMDHSTQDMTISIVKSGFICRAVNWNFSTKNIQTNTMDDTSKVMISSATNRKPHAGKYYFLNDWELFYSHLANDDNDEIAEQLPLFRAAMELIFHRRIVQFMYIVFAWNLSLLAVLQSHYNKNTRGLAGTSFIAIGFELIVYMLVCLMIKGPQYIRPINVFLRSSNTVSEDSINVDAGQDADESREVAQEAIDQEFSLIATLRRLWYRGKLEFLFLFSGVIIRGNNRTGNAINGEVNKKQASNKKGSIFFDRWINMGLKVLIRAYGIDLSQINFNRRSYRFMTFFAIVLFPIYSIVLDYVGFISSVKASCEDRSTLADDHSCLFYTIQFVFSICGLSFALDNVLYGCSILVALVGLAYGGEIAFRLAECWIQKYHALRRIKAKLPARKEPGKGAKALSINQESKLDEINDMKTNKLLQSFLARASIQDTWEYPGDESKMQKIIRRDAIEHYLFISALLRKAGDMWSPLLMLFIFLVIYICLADVLYLTVAVQLTKSAAVTIFIVRITVYVTIRILVLVVYPILSITFANSYFIKMYDIFRIADDEDYELIGGRDYWLNVFSDSPATWTFFGLAITPERLAALLWTSLVALGGVFLSSMITNSHL